MQLRENYTILKGCKIRKSTEALREELHYCTLPAVGHKGMSSKLCYRDTLRYRVASRDNAVGRGSVVKCNECGIVWATDNNYGWRKKTMKTFLGKVRACLGRIWAQKQVHPYYR